jgi:hypothetical protein
MKYNVSVHNDTAKPYITSVSNSINSTDNIIVVFNEKMKEETITDFATLSRR